MELSKKTTILFPPELHEQLTRLAAREGTSLGELVRRAVVTEYRLVPARERLEAVSELAALELPVSTPRQMKLESVPEADDLLP